MDSAFGTERFEVVSPMGRDDTRPASGAERVGSLAGKTICAVSNNRFRADVVLAKFGELLKERYPTAKFVPWTEMPTIEAMGDVEADARALREAYVRHGADAVIASTGA